jgi:hypothetical protein
MSEPKIESVAGYANGKAPDAATFNGGASDRAGVQQAADARRAHGAEIANRKATPGGR